MESESDQCKKVLRPKQVAILKKIGQSADASHETCYLVGGIVRDCLEGKEGDDLDVVCTNPVHVVQKLQELDPSVKEIKKSETARFQSKILLIDGEKVDMVQPRKESYTKESIKPIVSQGDFMDDVYRRDFTINTLYLGVGKADFLQIHDLTQRGIPDLRNKILDTPLEPDQTFEDDPSRMMRAVRFASCKKMTMSPRVRASIQKKKRSIHRVPTELIHKEIVEKSGGCRGYFRTLDDLGLLEEIIPEMTAMKGLHQYPKGHTKDVFGHTLALLDHLPNDPILQMAGLLHDVGKVETTDAQGHAFGHPKKSKEKAQQIVERLKFSTDEQSRIVTLVENHHLLHNFLNQYANIDQIDDKTLRRVIHKYDSILPDIAVLSRADILSDHPNPLPEVHRLDRLLDRLSAIKTVDASLVSFKLAITGHDIMQYGYSGKEIGIIKDQLEDAVIEGKIPNTKEALLSLIHPK